MKKCLVFLTGISDAAYGIEQVSKKKLLWNKLVNKYGRQHIYEIDYQKILDKHAFAFKSLMDPVRLVMLPKGWRAEKYVQDELQRLNKIYDEVDVISHSLGSWIVLKCKAFIHNLYLVASPIGWIAPLARTFVQLNVGRPKVVVDNLFYIYSESDPVSMNPPTIEGKWRLKADKLQVIDTGTSHDLQKYLIALNSRYPEMFRG